MRAVGVLGMLVRMLPLVGLLRSRHGSRTHAHHGFMGCVLPLLLGCALNLIPQAAGITCYTSNRTWIQSCDSDGSQCKNRWQARLNPIINDTRNSANASNYISCISYLVSGRINQVDNLTETGWIYKSTGSPGPSRDGRGTHYSCEELINTDGTPTDVAIMLATQNYAVPNGLVDGTLTDFTCCTTELCNDQLGSNIPVASAVFIMWMSMMGFLLLSLYS